MRSFVLILDLVILTIRSVRSRNNQIRFRKAASDFARFEPEVFPSSLS